MLLTEWIIKSSMTLNTTSLLTSLRNMFEKYIPNSQLRKTEPMDRKKEKVDTHNSLQDPDVGLSSEERAKLVGIR